MFHAGCRLIETIVAAGCVVLVLGACRGMAAPEPSPASSSASQTGGDVVIQCAEVWVNAASTVVQLDIVNPTGESWSFHRSTLRGLVLRAVCESDGLREMLFNTQESPLTVRDPVMGPGAWVGVGPRERMTFMFPLEYPITPEARRCMRGERAQIVLKGEVIARHPPVATDFLKVESRRNVREITVRGLGGTSSPK